MPDAATEPRTPPLTDRTVPASPAEVASAVARMFRADAVCCRCAGPLERRHGNVCKRCALATEVIFHATQSLRLLKQARGSAERAADAEQMYDERRRWDRFVWWAAVAVASAIITAGAVRLLLF